MRGVYAWPGAALVGITDKSFSPQIFPLSGCCISTSAEQAHQFDSVAQFATILNQVAAFCVGGAVSNLHRYLAYNASKEIDQRALIVVRIAHLLRLTHQSIAQVEGSVGSASVTKPTRKWQGTARPTIATAIVAKQVKRKEMGLHLGPTTWLG